MQSLLGLFYSRIKGSQEDIASEGLAYILQQSAAARSALAQLLEADTRLSLPELHYRTQTTGEQRERPDISGYDPQGGERVILEAKFWAALTENQPVTYLNRLPADAVLAFVVPSLRVQSVQSELQHRLQQAGISFEAHGTTLRLADNQFLVIKTWSEVLNTLKIRLVQENAAVLLSDIDQLIGLCDTIDQEAFLPIQAEDFSPGIARRLLSYNALIDKVVDVLKREAGADTTGLKTTPQSYGYTRYFRLMGMGVGLEVRYDYWANRADTPFWIRFYEDGENWKRTEQMRIACRTVAARQHKMMVENQQREVFFALFPPFGQTEDLVRQHLVHEVISLMEAVSQGLAGA